MTPPGSVVWRDGMIEYNEFADAIETHELMTGLEGLADQLRMHPDLLGRIRFGEFGASYEGNYVTIYTRNARYIVYIDPTMDADVMEFMGEDC